MQIDEQTLLNRCLKKDREAQKLLYDTYKSRMFSTVRRYVRHSCEVDDIFQEAFVKVFTHLHTLTKGQSLGGWIKRVVINTALNHYRSNLKYIHQEKVGEAEPLNNIESGYILSNLYNEDLLWLIQQLPDAYRIVFNLYIIDGYDHAEIAASLNISESTSRSTLSRAKVKLKALLLKSDCKTQSSKP